MARSTMMRRSYRAARSMAAARSSGAFTLLMPTLEPRLAGLTKQGKPISTPMPRAIGPGSRSQSCRRTVAYSTIGRLWARKRSFIATLSMPLAEARGQALGGLHAHERGPGVGGGGPLEQLALGGGVRAALGEGLARGLLGQRAQRIAAHQPAAVLGDADGHQIEAAPVHGRHHRRGAGEGDLVLARPAAEHHADP